MFYIDVHVLICIFIDTQNNIVLSIPFLPERLKAKLLPIQAVYLELSTSPTITLVTTVEVAN